MPESDFASVIPAQLSFLAIYNPLLGPTDETLNDQILFYTSRSSRLRRAESNAAEDGNEGSKEESNDRLRQIGLAQGMVGFAKTFSEGKALEYVETEKSRIVLHELEKNWWILASVDLTRIPSDSHNGASLQRDAADSPSFVYSSRELCPPPLMIQQLRRAHALFLLHHDFTLNDLYDRVGRPTLCARLERFWGKFAWNWEVLLSGNPAVDMYDGIKLSAGGELGIGVGEEEWGSGEREVLEDFVFRTDGLVDLIVSRFGDPPTQVEDKAAGGIGAPWLGFGAYPRSSDGVIFSGVGGISRPSVARISQWMEWIYRHGDGAYGVGEDPISPRRRKQRRKQRGRLHSKGASISSNARSPSEPLDAIPPEIPRPLVVGTPPPPQGSERGASPRASSNHSPARSEQTSDWSGLRPETFMKYLTLGYGSSWFASNPHPPISASKQDDGPANTAEQEGPSSDTKQYAEEEATQGKPKMQDLGRFIVGLREGEDLSGHSPDSHAEGKQNGRMNPRILHVPLAIPEQERQGLKAVVYLHQPFIFTFLFDTETPSLSNHSLYDRIRHQLFPLHKTLSNSTSPTTAATRISVSENEPATNQQQQPVYDLVYDPTNLTIRSSIPNIPDLVAYTMSEPLTSRHPSKSSQPWSRIECINIHHQLMSTYLDTRARPLEIERTCKTSRGWWIVWVRMAPSTPTLEPNNDPTTPTTTTTTTTLSNTAQEAFLVRKASDTQATNHSRGASLNSGGGGSTSFFRDLGGAPSSFSLPSLTGGGVQTDLMGPARLVEGLGLDARRYIERLLSLNR